MRTCIPDSQSTIEHTQFSHFCRYGAKSDTIPIYLENLWILTMGTEKKILHDDKCLWDQGDSSYITYVTIMFLCLNADNHEIGCLYS